MIEVGAAFSSTYAEARIKFLEAAAIAGLQINYSITHFWEKMVKHWPWILLCSYLPVARPATNC